MTSSRRKHRSRQVPTDEPSSGQLETPSIDTPEEPPKEPKTIEALGLEFAGPMRRTYAFAIDIGILLMVVYVAAPIFGNSENIFVIPSLQNGIVDVFIFLAYFIIPTGLFGRTIGKWVAGVRVVDDEGNKPGVAIAIPREMVGRFVSTITFGIGIIWVIFDGKRQGWHDKIAGTYVVITPNSGGPGLLARMFAPQEEAKPEPSRQQRVGRPANRRKRRKRHTN